MWFDEIMDDCKQALVTANKHKIIFTPIFLKFALSLGIIAYVVISIILGVIRYQYKFEYIFTDYYSFMEVLPVILINGIIIYLLVLAGYSLIDAGSINMYKFALEDQKPRYKDFIEGVKNYFFKIVLGKLFMHLMIVVTLPVTAVAFLLYALIVGTLTAGWGMLFLTVSVSVYLGTWVSITVIEGCSPIKAIGKSIRLGRKYFKGLFIILLASTLIGSYSTAIFGLLVTIVAGWFLYGLVATYFQLIVMRIYYRNREII